MTERGPADATRALASGIAAVLARAPEIAAAWLFGSAARGELRPGSDIDIGLVFRRRGDTALDHLDLIGTIAARLEAVTGARPVDLVVLESQGPAFRQAVVRDGILILDADRERRIDFVSTTYSLYQDWKPTAEFARRQVLPGLRRRLESLR